MYWLSFDRDDGELRPEEDIDILITLDATGYFGGEYEAELYIDSNDPRTPRVTVNVQATITGIPDILVEWADDCGFPNNMDWNQYYQDLFTGGPYPIGFQISNEGTDDLVIEDIASNHDYFRVAFEEELILSPRETANLEALFEAPIDDPGEFEGEITILSNDPDAGETTIPLHAEAIEPPRIAIDLDLIEAALNSGETAEAAINIANDGAGLLRFNITHEYLAQPDDDQAQRDVRSVERPGPARDDPGDIISRWAWERAPVNNHKAGIAFDLENRLLFVTTRQVAPAQDPSTSWMSIFVLGEQIALRREWSSRGNMIMGAAFLDGVFYNVSCPGSFLNRWDENGENLGDLQLDFRPASITASQELGVLLVTDDESRDISILTPEAERVGIIEREAYVGLIGDRDQRSICWVDAHREGHLWINTPGRIFQLDVNPRDWEVEGLRRDFAWDGNNEWDGIGYDGVNLWLGGANQNDHLCVDDGDSDGQWLSYEPSAGELEGENDVDVIVTLNAEGLFEGEYLAEMTIAHNNPGRLN